KMITVTDTVWADYVFADDYDLMSLEATEQFIKSNKHLPEMPSQAQISKEGRNLGDIQVKLLQKIEELTLHMIEMKKDNAEIRKENSALKARLEKLETRNGEN
ncbi:MAG: hypothetical protein KDC80_10700, partial [Saprospiraceae bacterium]|nr:hypothetical protein [Saprospiraceae bacterium]